MNNLREMAIFGKTFDCECGKRHAVEPREIVYDADAINLLPAVCARATKGRRVVLIMDARTRHVGGRDAASILRAADWLVSEIVVPDRGGGERPVCDDRTKEWLENQAEETDLMLAVGSGVLSDLAKWIAVERGIPFVVLATAASMNGYASANVAPTIRGVKSLVRAQPPYAVLASPTTLAAAPDEMTAAGLGDILAKSVSTADWQLNHVLFGDFYCARAARLIEGIEPLYLQNPLALRAREPEAFEALFNGLLLTGAAMTMAETSAPASGGEHMIGHALDMMAALDGARHDLHGRQVGVGTILASELYRRVLSVESPEFRAPTTEVDRSFWGKLGGVVAEHYAEKTARLDAARSRLAEGDAWDDLRARFAPLVRPPEITRDCLKLAGAAWQAGDIGCDEKRLLNAFLHAHEMRARFTVLDLARLVGVLPDAAGEIVNEWA